MMASTLCDIPGANKLAHHLKEIFIPFNLHPYLILSVFIDFLKNDVKVE